MNIKFFLILLLFFSQDIYSQDATEILEESEERIRGIKSSYTEMIITVVRPKWSKEMKMKMELVMKYLVV